MPRPRGSAARVVTKLLVVDDSALMRRVLAEIFRGEDDFELAFARDGVEALIQLHAFQPDVITLDVQMPQMDGLNCLDRIMVERPCPVVMVSALTADGAEATLSALELGAVDFVLKPPGTVSLAIDDLSQVLIEKVRAAAASRLPSSHRLAERLRTRAAAGPASVRAEQPRLPVRRAPALEGVVIIGCSTGGPPALDAVLSRLPGTFPWPILVAQHMPSAFTASLAHRLDGLCALSVMEVVRPTALAAGSVYIARGDADMIVSRRGNGPVAMPVPSGDSYRWHPSVDRLVSSAAEIFSAAQVVGLLMTGMGNDGAKAMTALRASGGRTIAESEESAVIWGMPGELVRAGGADAIVPLEMIAGRLAEMVAAG